MVERLHPGTRVCRLGLDLLQEREKFAGPQTRHLCAVFKTRLPGSLTRETRVRNWKLFVPGT